MDMNIIPRPYNHGREDFLFILETVNYLGVNNKCNIVQICGKTVSHKTLESHGAKACEKKQLSTLR